MELLHVLWIFYGLYKWLLITIIKIFIYNCSRMYYPLRPGTFRFSIKTWIYLHKITLFAAKCMDIHVYLYHSEMFWDLFEKKHLGKKYKCTRISLTCFKLTKFYIHVYCKQWEMYNNTGNTYDFVSKPLFSYYYCFPIHCHTFMKFIEEMHICINIHLHIYMYTHRPIHILCLFNVQKYS